MSIDKLEKELKPSEVTDYKEYVKKTEEIIKRLGLDPEERAKARAYYVYCWLIKTGFPRTNKDVVAKK